MNTPGLIFFLGKGGVGKSTLAAASALQLARKGRRVHLLSLDPAHNLGDLFGSRRKKFRPLKNLQVEEADPSTLTRTYLKEVRDEAAAHFRYWSTMGLDLEGMIGLLQKSPGVEEYALLRALTAAVDKKDKEDILVVDTPPTALALRILTLAGNLEEWTGRLAIQRSRILKERFSLHRLSGGRVPISGFTEEEDPVSGRLDSLQSRYGALDSLLRGQDCRMYVVATPARLARMEAGRIISALEEAGLRPAALIRNRSGKEQPAGIFSPEYSIPGGAAPETMDQLGGLPLGFITEE